MRTIGAVLLATTLIASSAFAASPPLAGGKPAGVKNAAVFGPNGALIFFGVAIVAGGLALSLSNNSNGITSPTTSSTGTGLP